MMYIKAMKTSFLQHKAVRLIALEITVTPFPAVRVLTETRSILSTAAILVMESSSKIIYRLFLTATQDFFSGIDGF